MSGRKKGDRYSTRFKWQVIEEVRRGELSQSEAGRKYGIRGHSTISKWIRKLGGELPLKTIVDKNEKQAYLERIRDLEQALEQERIRSQAYEEMINIAEDHFKIPISKKSNTKQSKT